MSTLVVVEQVMRESKTPMAVRDIVELAGDALPTRSKTPDTVVARDLSMNIKRLGDESRFVRTAPGRYTMREFVDSGLIQMGDSGSTPQPIRQQAPTIPVLGSALATERRGLLPSTPAMSSTALASSAVASSAVASSAVASTMGSSVIGSSAVSTPVPEVSPQDDVNSL